MAQTPLAALLVVGGSGLSCGEDGTGDLETRLEAVAPCRVEVDTPVSILSFNGALVHWPLSLGCIDVTYGPEVAELAAEVAQAVEVLNAIACSSLCLEAPRREGGFSSRTARHRIHFDLLAQPPSDPDVQSSINFQTDTGRVQTVQIGFAPATLTDLPAEEVLRAMMQALGLYASASPGVDTILDRASFATTPTAADIETLCTVYGSPPLCGD